MLRNYHDVTELALTANAEQTYFKLTFDGIETNYNKRVWQLIRQENYLAAFNTSFYIDFEKSIANVKLSCLKARILCCLHLQRMPEAALWAYHLVQSGLPDYDLQYRLYYFALAFQQLHNLTFDEQQKFFLNLNAFLICTDQPRNGQLNIKMTYNAFHLLANYNYRSYELFYAKMCFLLRCNQLKSAQALCEEVAFFGFNHGILRTLMHEVRAKESDHNPEQMILRAKLAMIEQAPNFNDKIALKIWHEIQQTYSIASTELSVIWQPTPNPKNGHSPIRFFSQSSDKSANLVHLPEYQQNNRIGQ